MIKITEAKLLIVDDDDKTCETLHDIFQEVGYDITIAFNGREAIKRIEKMIYNVAFIDINLPDTDGITLLKKFKKSFPEMILFIITGNANVHNAINALKGGANDYFLKPLPIEKLIKRTRELLEIQHLRQELKESEEKYRHLINNIADVIVEMDLEGNITYISSQIFDKFGYQPNEVIGLNFIEFIHPEDLKLIEEVMEQPIKSREIITVEYRSRHQKGHYIPVSGRTNLVEINGNLKYIGIVRDITERKKMEVKLRQSEEIFRAVFETAKDSIFIKNRSLQYIHVNAAMEKLFDLPAEKLIKKTDIDLFGEVDGKHLMNIDQRVIQGEIVEDERIKSIKDVLHTFHTIKVPLKDVKGNIFGICGIARDITERKKSENALKESEEKYHDAYDRAEFYKDLLVHDINNIINNILSSVELFTCYFDDPKKLKNIKELLEIVREQVIKGEKLVSNIHELSRLEEAEISISSIEVCSVIKDALNSIRKSFQTRNIDIKVDSVDEKFYIQANELLLDVFENVLINAVKYNENPIVEILIRISKKQKERVKYIKLEFTDNGIGITDDRKKEIFQKSYKKDKNAKGMGFGLSLVSKVITSYNGQIWVEDRVRGDYSKGCNFMMLIPETI